MAENLSFPADLRAWVARILSGVDEVTDVPWPRTRSLVWRVAAGPMVVIVKLSPTEGDYQREVRGYDYTARILADHEAPRLVAANPDLRAIISTPLLGTVVRDLPLDTMWKARARGGGSPAAPLTRPVRTRHAAEPPSRPRSDAGAGARICGLSGGRRRPLRRRAAHLPHSPRPSPMSRPSLNAQANAAGCPGPIAISVELMAIGSGLELRRRRKYGQPAAWPRFTLALGIGMSLATNLAAAGPGSWGNIMAAWPVVAFACVVGWIETRRPTRTTDQPSAHHPQATTSPAPAAPVPPADHPAPVPVDRAREPMPVPPPGDAAPAVEPVPPVPAPTTVPVPPAATSASSVGTTRPTATQDSHAGTVTVMPAADELEDARAATRQMYATSLAAGTPLTVADMARATGRSERWCKTRRAEVHAAQG